MPSSIVPYPLAMVVCDAVHRDFSTGKAYLLGCFAVIHARDFPAVHPIMCLYLALTDAEGDLQLDISLADVDEERDPVWQAQAKTVSNDRLAVHELALPVLNVAFPEPGEYRFKLSANGSFLMERRILVLPLPNQRTPDEQHHE